MAFTFAGTRGGYSVEKMVYILAASTAFTVGDAVLSYSQTDSSITVGAAAAPLLGILTGFVDKFGNAYTAGNLAAGTALSTVLSTKTTASTNVSSPDVYGEVTIGQNVRWSAAVNGTLGTTGNSNKAGCGIDVDSSNTSYGRVLETTATRTFTTATNFYSEGVDPKISTRLIVILRADERTNDSY